MSGYLFIENSNKPSIEKANSRDTIILDNVSIPCVKSALKRNYTVWVGVNRNNADELKCDYPVKLYDSHTYRSITAMKDNLIAYKNACDVVKKNDISIIHCNTPVGGMIGRLVGKRYGVHKVIYTAHGFHFYKGASFFNRTIIKMAERIMARWTDVIITMNEEDFQAAKRFKLRKGGSVYKVHGVGITLADYQNPNNREDKRNELGITDSDIVFISAGDLIERKNYALAIQAIALANNRHIHYFICGQGPELKNLEDLSKELGIDCQIHFLGFRNDIKELLYAADVFLFTTLQEGLPRSMMEAMACGLPCIASKVRGNIDLLEDKKGGFLCDITDVSDFVAKINVVANDENLRKRMSDSNLQRIKEFDIKVVEKEIDSIYEHVLN